MVTIPDAKAVTGAITELSKEAWGRPQDDKQDAEGVTFVRQALPPAA